MSSKKGQRSPSEEIEVAPSAAEPPPPPSAAASAAEPGGWAACATRSEVEPSPMGSFASAQITRPPILPPPTAEIVDELVDDSAVTPRAVEGGPEVMEINDPLDSEEEALDDAKAQLAEIKTTLQTDAEELERRLGRIQVFGIVLLIATLAEAVLAMVIGSMRTPPTAVFKWLLWLGAAGLPLLVLTGARYVFLWFRYKGIRDKLADISGPLSYARWLS